MEMATKDRISKSRMRRARVYFGRLSSANY
ncbi:hypothetical protein JMJ77_0001919, partial [Colletotrichum scovillei]